MNEEPKITNNDILALLIDKQVNKIIEANRTRDCYFSIRQNFDIDQFLWDIATYIYSSIGEKINFAATIDKIKECQESAYLLYANEQEKQKQEQDRIFRESLQAQKESIEKEIDSLKVKLNQVSDQQIATQIELLLKIVEFKEELRNLLIREKDLILSDLNKAMKDYNYDLALQVKYGILDLIESKIEEVNEELSQIDFKVKSKINEEERIKQKIKEDEENSKLNTEKHFLNIVKQIASGTEREETLINILKLIESNLEINYQVIELDSDISDDLGADELDTVELAMAIEEMIEIEIPDDLLGSYRVGGFSDGRSYPISCTIKQLLDFISSKLT